MSTNSKKIDLTVPWGTLSLQTFGVLSIHSKAIVATHGYLDNSNSFKPLSEQFLRMNNDDYFIIAIDLPGHGLSSHSPSGIYNPKMFIIAMRFVVKYFKFKSCILLGHSYGCMVSLLYASCYPDEVDSIVLLDFILNNNKKLSSTTLPRLWNIGIDSFVDAELDETVVDDERVLTKEIALKKLMKANKHVDEQAALLLLERGLITNSKTGKLEFTRDTRVRFQLQQPDHYTDFHVVRDSLKMYMKCPLLLVYAQPASYGVEAQERTLRFIKSLRNSSNECKATSIEGTHHFHMIKPAETAQILLKFFSDNLPRFTKKKSIQNCNKNKIARNGSFRKFYVLVV